MRIRSTELEGLFPSLFDCGRFVRQRRLSVAVTSAVVLIPVFWHRHLEACDLPSHTYNSWLAELIARGRAPGLCTISQWSNVLFDYMLGSATRLLGYAAGEKIAVSACVLLFFWGAFAFVSRLAAKPSWEVMPLLAMLTYGWVFNMGFMNLYLSAALSFWVLALGCGGGIGDYAIAAVLLVLVSRAHALGIVWAVFALVFLALYRNIDRRWYLPVAILSLLGFFLLRQYIAERYRIFSEAPDSPSWMMGADQFVLFGDRYRILGSMLALFFVLCIGVCACKFGKSLLAGIAIPATLFLLMAVVVYFSPPAFLIPGMQGALGFLPERLSLFSALIACCTLAALPLFRWQVAGFYLFALAFFGFLYSDTAKIDAAESRLEQVLQKLPTRQEKVIGTLEVQGSRIALRHILDRACIGKCYSYANYEPASEQFRIRTAATNRIVVSDEGVSRAMQGGIYLVQSQDLPLYEVRFCGSTVSTICVEELEPGMLNDDLRITPPPRWQ